MSEQDQPIQKLKPIKLSNAEIDRLKIFKQDIDGVNTQLSQQAAICLHYDLKKREALNTVAALDTKVRKSQNERAQFIERLAKKYKRDLGTINHDIDYENGVLNPPAELLDNGSEG